MKKRLEGAALELPPGLTRPGPCEPEFWKNEIEAYKNEENFMCDEFHVVLRLNGVLSV